MTAVRARLAAVVAAVAVATGAAAATGAPPTGASISPSRPTVSWSGALTTGSADAFAIRVDVPSSYWARHDGGVSVRIEWTARDTELDLRVADGRGRQLAESIYGGRTFQQVYLYRPARGSYRITVDAVAAVNATYKGTVALVADPVRKARRVAGDMRFQQGLVDAQLLVKEPGISFGKDARTYVVASSGTTSVTSTLWSSDDGGRTHTLRAASAVPGVPPLSTRPCHEGIGGGDSDVTVDRTGRLYFAALSGAEVATGYSVDGGRTWACTAAGSTVPEIDRPWLAAAPKADGAGPAIDAYLVYHDLALGQLPVGQEVKPVQIHVDATRDGGRTWQARSAYGRGLVPFAGPVFVASDGTLYQSFQAGNAAWLATSTDEGASFTLHRVAQRHGDAGNVWVTGAVDRAGTVYVAWVDSGSYRALYSYSRDRGAHWSAPIQVSPDDQIAMLPWITAGAAGDVAVSWYGAKAATIPDLVSQRTPWHATVARSSEAASPRPTFGISALSAGPAHLGPICTPCVADHGLLGDMLEIEIAADGQLIGAYNDNARPDAAYSPPYPYVVLARQVSGLGMSPAQATRAASAVEARGDAAVPQLDLAALPHIAMTGPTTRVSFSLTSAKDLAAAVSGTDTDAYWLVLWKADGRMQYAGMHVGPDSAPEFFGGDTPVGVEATGSAADAVRRQVYASYPAEHALRGAVDPARGRVTIELPRSVYGLARGDALHLLQAFSFTGLTAQRTANTMLRAADSTPARSLSLR